MKIFNFAVIPDDGSRNYSMKMLAADTGEIWIYEEIGSSWFGGISAKQFGDDLKSLKAAKNINVRINSPGGEVFDGLAIYNLLRAHPANICVTIDGMALSIASVIAMAGDEVHMADNAMMMIHDPWMIAAGSAEDFRKMAGMLDMTTGNILDAYLKKCRNQERPAIADLMKAETWMTAQMAQEMGFVDTIGEPLQLAAHFDLSKFKYRKTPANYQREANNTRQKLAIMSIHSQKARAASGSK